MRLEDVALEADRLDAGDARATHHIGERRALVRRNPNPQIARGEDFAASAEAAGISYESLIQRIVNLGLRWQPESQA
ncbi:MAG: hypothetical protein QM736_05750 [Vicinamibacterales bacterium]